MIPRAKKNLQKVQESEIRTSGKPERHLPEPHLRIMSVDMDMKSQVSAPDDGPKPTHYLARGTDKYTPLIPLDELPDFVKIAGVVVYINQSELLNLHGTGCFPIIPKSSVPYTVDVDNLYRRSDSPDSSFQASMNVPSSRVRDVSQIHSHRLDMH